MVSKFTKTIASGGGHLNIRQYYRTMNISYVVIMEFPRGRDWGLVAGLGVAAYGEPGSGSLPGVMKCSRVAVGSLPGACPSGGGHLNIRQYYRTMNISYVVIMEFPHGRDWDQFRATPLTGKQGPARREPSVRQLADQPRHPFSTRW